MSPLPPRRISAAGVRAALDMQGQSDVNVLAWAGDGGTFDIGLQSLSGAAERNDNIIYVCYDNEAYMNTGIQRSSATPYGAWTTTTPVESPKSEPKKEHHGDPGGAQDPVRRNRIHRLSGRLLPENAKGKDGPGTRFIHLWVTCPTGYKSEERYSIKIARLAVETGMFPLYEVEHGTRYTINRTPAFSDLTEYLNLQGRFRHLTEAQIETMRRNIKWEWKRLEAKVEMGRKLEVTPTDANITLGVRSCKERQCESIVSACATYRPTSVGCHGAISHSWTSTCCSSRRNVSISSSKRATDSCFVWSMMAAQFACHSRLSWMRRVAASWTGAKASSRIWTDRTSLLLRSV